MINRQKPEKVFKLPYGKVEIYDNHYNVISKNGRVLATSEQYATHQGAIKGAEAIVRAFYLGMEAEDIIHPRKTQLI